MLLERLGCDVTMLFEEPTGRFPREPEPLAENLTTLAETVKKQGADIGFAFDPGAEGTFVLQCVISSGGRTICDFEKPIVVGKPSAQYRMAPAGERIPPEVMEREPMTLSTDVVRQITRLIHLFNCANAARKSIVLSKVNRTHTTATDHLGHYVAFAKSSSSLYRSDHCFQNLANSHYTHRWVFGFK